MSYIDDIQKFSEKNQFDYNHKQIYKQVKKAMKKTGAERTEALIDVLKTNYLADVKRYEHTRLDKRTEASFASGRKASVLMDKLAAMAIAPAFLEEYVSIINIMAMDIDSTYNPKFMLGMKMDMTKELVDAHLNAITPYEHVKRSLKAEGWEEATRNAENAKTSPLTRTPIKYNDLTSEPDREVVHQAYIRKEIVKKELSEMGFFKKYLTGEGRAMRNYLKTVEETLKAVSFPEKDGAAVMREFTKGLTPESDVKRIHSYIDLKYSSLAKGENAIQAEDVQKELEKQPAKAANKEDVKKKNNVNTKKKAAPIDYDAQFAEREREQAEQLKLDAAADLKKIEGLKKPQSAAESNAQRRNNRKAIANVFAFSLVSVGAKQKDALSVSNTIIGVLQRKLASTWEKRNEYETMLFSKDIFKDVYFQVNRGFSNLKVEDKLVVSQKIANLLLNNFSSIAKNPDYKKYAESYAIQTLTNKEIQEITGCEQNVEDLMKGVKAELGIAVKEDVENEKESDGAINEVPEEKNVDKIQIDVSKDVEEKKSNDVAPRVEQIESKSKERLFNN